MMYNVFNTEQEAIDAQALDFVAWKANKPQMPVKYWEVTTAWATPQERLDGRWVYPVCPDGSQNHTQELRQADWFADEYPFN